LIMDHIDHDTVFDLVLHAGEQMVGGASIDCGIPGARRCPGKRT